MTSDGDAVIVALADLTPSFMGAPSPLAEPFGSSGSLLRATVDRAARAGLGRVVVAYRESPRNTSLPELATGSDTTLVTGPMGTNDATLVAAALEMTGARDAIVIDARWPFVHPELLRMQLATHRSAGAELTFAGMAADGLAGIVISRGAIARVATALANAIPLSFDISLRELCEQVRSTFECADTDVPEELVCMPAALRCTTHHDVDRLAPFALAADSTDYERVFAAECRAAWSVRLARQVPRKRPKILFCAYTTSPEPGSVVAFKYLLERMDRERYELVLAMPNRGALYEQFASELRSLTLPVRWIHSSVDHRWATDVHECARVLHAEDPDLVYANGTVAAMAVAARSVGIPCIAHMHLPILKLGPMASPRFSRHAAVTFYDAIIAPAQTAASQLRAAFRPPAGRITTVECGISTATFDPSRFDRAEARARLGLPKSARVVSFVGMLLGLKRPEAAVEAIAQVASTFPDVLLAIAGTERVLSGYQQRLENLAASLGVTDNVRFLGHIDNVVELYAASDVFLHTAVGDTFPLVILEAMSMELPVVALADGGACESVADRVTGRLVPMPGAPADFASALGDVLADRDGAKQMGHRARLRAIEHYDASLYARRIEQICDHVIAGTPIE